MPKEKTLIRVEQGDVIIQMKVRAPEEIIEGIEHQLRSMASFLMAIDIGEFWPYFSKRWGLFIIDLYEEFIILEDIRRRKR